MAAEVVFRKRARDDLSDLFDYLYRRSQSAAQTYIADIEHACFGLADFPEKAPRYDDRYRALAVRNHVVFYLYEPSRNLVVVARILDGRRDIDKLMKTFTTDVPPQSD